MNSGIRSTFTSARVVALVVIALAVLALVYLRLASGAQSVAVPAGATAGELMLKPCTVVSENRSYAADCGTLVVPENRAAKGSRLIALPVTRIHGLSHRSAAPIFYLEGGPGLTNTTFEQAGRFVADRDVVLVGYRGVDGSVRLDCPEVVSALKHSTDVLSEASFRAYGDGMRACSNRLTREGVDLAGYGLPQQVGDLEAARVALGYHRIDLLSQSAGTRTAMVYAWRHPTSIERSVMIGVNPPGGFLWDEATMNQQIGRYAALCAKDATCRQRTADLSATMRATSAHVPDRWLLFPIKKGDARMAAFFGLAESTTKAGLESAPATFDSWLAAAHGDPSGLWLQTIVGDLLLPNSFVWGEYADAGTLDARTARDYFSSAHDRGSIAYAGTAFVWGGGRLADAWPAAPDEGLYRRVQASDVATLLISGQLDTATPPQPATRDLLPRLRNGHQVVLPNVGHIASFFGEQPAAGSRLINSFLSTGRVDTSLYRPQAVDFTPGTTAPATAKVLLGIMGGLACLTVASIVGMAYRVRARGHLGRTASVLVRSVGSPVLGVGGWFLGLLVVLATMPAVSIDDEVLAVVATGIPIGLAVALAWVHLDWSTRMKVAGFGAAAAGALIGAWLGFHATGGFLALGTTILAATLGANLALLALDVGRDLRTRAAPPAAQPGSGEQPSRHEAPEPSGVAPAA